MFGSLTKTPKFLRGVLGDSWLDEAGAVGGFFAGGPAGAAAGSAAGSAAGTAVARSAQGKNFNLKDVALSGAKAYGAGAGASYLGGKVGLAGVSRVAPSLASSGANPALTSSYGGSVYQAPRAATSLAGRVAGYGSQAGGFLKKNPEVGFMALQAVGDAAGGARADRLQNEDLARQRRIDAAREAVLRQMDEDYRTQDPGNIYRNRYR